MIRDVWRKLRSAAVLSTVWGAGFGLATLALVAATFLIPPLNPSPGDLIEIPIWSAAGGFFLGAVFSTIAALGTRNGRLSRWKAGLLGFASGPVAAVGYNFIDGRPPLTLVAEGGLFLGLLIGAVAFLMVSLVSSGGVDDADALTSAEPTLIDEPPLDVGAAHATSERAGEPVGR